MAITNKAINVSSAAITVPSIPAATKTPVNVTVRMILFVFWKENRLWLREATMKRNLQPLVSPQAHEQFRTFGTICLPGETRTEKASSWLPLSSCYRFVMYFQLSYLCGFRTFRSCQVCCRGLKFGVSRRCQNGDSAYVLQ